jgi:WXG100 family type VII secretion target
MECDMTAFRVTPAELLGLSQQVHGTAGQIESELSTLRSRVLPIGATWSGQAQDRFQALYDEWSRSAAGLQQALAGISALLAQAGHTYDDAERRIAGSFAGR